MSKLSPWYQLTFEKPSPEFENLIIEMGVSGTELTESSLICWLDSREIDIECFLDNTKRLGLNCKSKLQVVDCNWVAKCKQIWEKLDIQKWKVKPVKNPAKPPKANSNDLLIIPGSGFGTGHHPTTKMILSLMQSFSEECNKSISGLDIGTGSGILAIAAAKFWGVSFIGVDIDEHAINNAIWNRKLNEVSTKFKIIQGTAYCLQKKFDLIFANILAEILIELEPWITQNSLNNSHLFLSGILESEIDLILSCFSKAWEPKQALTEDSWSALVLQKKFC